MCFKPYTSNVYVDPFYKLQRYLVGYKGEFSSGIIAY
jgi:hypothetical protein